MQRELINMQKRNVWELISRTNGMKTVKNKWVYSIKKNEEGDVKFKARLVAVGTSQKPGIHYKESFALVLKLESARMMLAIAAKGFQIRQYDVTAAYLYGELEETVHIESPGLVKDAEKVCRLRKSIYGLPQSGYQWNREINKTLIKLGWRRTVEDPCVYILEEQHEIAVYKAN